MKLNTKQQKTIGRLVESCFRQNKVDETKTRLVVKKLKTMPNGQAISALSLFITRLRSRLEKNTILIESPSKLSNVEIRRIVGEISKDHTVYQIQTKIEPSLITGIRVKIGDTILEDTYSSRSEQIIKTING